MLRVSGEWSFVCICYYVLCVPADSVCGRWLQPGSCLPRWHCQQRWRSRSFKHHRSAFLRTRAAERLGQCLRFWVSIDIASWSAFLTLQLREYVCTHYLRVSDSGAVVTCEMKLFQNYFSLRRRPCEIIFAEIISELFQRLIAAREYFPTSSMSLK